VRLAQAARLGLLLSALAGGALPAHAQDDATAPLAAPAQPGEPAAARAAAEQGLAEFVQRKLSHGAEAFDGHLPLAVADARELAGVRVGYGFEVHTLAPQDLADPRAELARLVKPTGVWRFVVQSGARAVGLVTVGQVDGRWQAVSFGASGLAQEVDAVMAAFADARHANVRFIRVFQAQSDLIEVAGADGALRYAPLRSAREALAQALPGAGTADVLTLREGRELVEPLRAAVKKNLDAAP
jgi:hypothetical protein